MLEKLVINNLLDPLAAGRIYSQAGGIVIGYAGFEIPVELITAAGAMPLQLSGLKPTDTKRADEYLEESFAPFVRVITENYLQGNLDFLKNIILPRSNDSAQRLYYYLCELRRSNRVQGPEPLIYDLAKIPRRTSQVYSEQATFRLAEELGTRESDLPRAISLRNQRRRLFEAVNRTRIGQLSLQGSFIDRVFRTADLCDADTFDRALSDWLNKIQGNTGIQGPRLLLSGSTPPDDRLHMAVEKGGGNIVSELGDFPCFSAQMPFIPEGGSISDIAEHYYSMPNSKRSFVDRSEITLACCRDASVDGVIQWLIEEEEALVWDVPSQIKTLESAGIPVLSLVRKRWDASDGVLDEIISFTKRLGDNV